MQMFSLTLDLNQAPCSGRGKAQALGARLAFSLSHCELWASTGGAGCAPTGLTSICPELCAQVDTSIQSYNRLATWNENLLAQELSRFDPSLKLPFAHLVGQVQLPGERRSTKKGEDDMSVWVHQFKHCLLQKTQRIDPYRDCASNNINVVCNKNPTLFMRDKLFTVSSTCLFSLRTAFWASILEDIFHKHCRDLQISLWLFRTWQTLLNFWPKNLKTMWMKKTRTASHKILLCFCNF